MPLGDVDVGAGLAAGVIRLIGDDGVGDDGRAAPPVVQVAADAMAELHGLQRVGNEGPGIACSTATWARSLRCPEATWCAEHRQGTRPTTQLGPATTVLKQPGRREARLRRCGCRRQRLADASGEHPARNRS